MPHWSVVFGGDFAPIGKHAAAISQPSEAFYGDVLPILRDADLAVINLEGVLTASDAPILKDGVPLKIPHETATMLAIAFDLVCLANNHTMDYGVVGLRDTASALAWHHIPHIGAGATLDEACQPFLITIQGVKIAILNAAEGEESASHGGVGVAPCDMERLRKRIHDLRADGAVVLVVMHAGREYIPFPAPYIQRAYRGLIEAGAAAVIGHHPHMPQGMESYQEGLIAYSLGNFAFLEGDAYPWARLGLTLRLNFSGEKLRTGEVMPHWAFDDHLERLQGKKSQEFLQRFAELSAVTSDLEKIQQLWNAHADDWLAQKLAAESVGWLGTLFPTRQLLEAARLSLDGQPGLKGKLWRRGLRLLERFVPDKVNESLEWRPRGAAALRNRFDTLAHRELFLTALERVMHGEAGNSEQWAKNVLRDWKNPHLV